MPVIRVNKTQNYTVMSNYHLKDKRLSLKAKGLLSMMLSLPDEWDYSIAGLVSISKENETAIKSSLDELKKNGYLVVTKKKPNETESGRFEYEYDIYEQPQERQDIEKQGVENLCLENQVVENQSVEVLDVENQGQLSTKESSTKESSTKQTKDAAARQSIDIEKEFEKLWSLYPRKEGKTRALDSYKKARKKHPEVYKQVEDGIRAYLAYLKATNTETRYIKHGSTWFYQRCWEDDYTIGESSNGSFEGHSKGSDADWGNIGITL